MQKIIELLEEQNEILRENSQLLGDVLNSLDKLSNTQPVINNTTTPINTPMIKRGPAPSPNCEALAMAMYGRMDAEIPETLPEIEVFWPKDSLKSKVPSDWVRVSIKHPSSDSLTTRVLRGCLCGRAIVLKEHDGGSFYTCEALALKGSCPHRPAAYFDKLTFLTNLPPQK